MVKELCFCVHIYIYTHITQRGNKKERKEKKGIFRAALVGVLEKETKKQKTIVCVFVEGNSRGKIEKGKRKIAIPICSIPKRKKKKERNHYKRKKERRSFKTNKP